MKYGFLIAYFFSVPVLAITNGQIISPEQAPAIVLIEDLKMNTIGTGVVIEDGIILTAEHSVGSQDPDSIFINGQKALSLLTVPESLQKNAKPVLDLALVKIKKGLLRTTFNIRQNPLPNHPLPVFLFGYGLAYTDDPMLVEDDRLALRVGRNTLEPNTPQSPFNRTEPYLNIDFSVTPYTEGEKSGAMVGDSGGPLIFDREVIGIASKSIHGTSNYVNLQGPVAKKFLNYAQKNGWIKGSLSTSSEKNRKATSKSSVQCRHIF